MSASIEREIYATFSEITVNMGYSEIHGRILAALFVAGKPLSLTELAHKIGVSVPAISLSLDLLETLGMARRIKMPGDRNLYVQLTGDLVSGLRTAFVTKAQRTLENTLTRFAEYRKRIKNDDDLMDALNRLEHESRRLKRYIDILGKAPL